MNVIDMLFKNMHLLLFKTYFKGGISHMILRQWPCFESKKRTPVRVKEQY